MDIKSPQGEARNEYLYSASGQKLQVVQRYNSTYNEAPIIGSAINITALDKTKTTDYVGNKIYEGGLLKRILVDGGYYDATSKVYHFYLTDHLGNNRVVAKADGTPIQKTHYYPFGAAFAEGLGDDAQPYKYNGKELDKMHGLNMYDYSARHYDGAIGRFTTVDPLAEKYYSISPYVYCYNNPIKFVDPNGLEGIVISGQPGGHKNREHFLVNGLNRAKAALKRVEKGEKVTWIIYNDGTSAGYTSDQIKDYTEKASELGIEVKEVSDSDDIVNYINKKDGGESRTQDQISNFYYVGHATPGDLDVGYGGSEDHFDPGDLKSKAFKSGARVNVVAGCRTAVSETWDKSIVEQFQGILDDKSTIYGSDVRTFYGGGIQSDTKLLEKNKGKIIERKGKIKSKK